MDKLICPVCKQLFDESETFEFDEFGKLDTPRIACKSCFFDFVRNYDLGECVKCSKKLAPVLDDELSIYYDGVIWFQCPNYINEDGHDDAGGMYIIQPEEDPWDSNDY